MKLRLVSKGKCFVGLTVELDLLLVDLRDKIKEEVQELMPSSFQFLFKNVPLGANQESRLTLIHCIEKSDEIQGLYTLHFKENIVLDDGIKVSDTYLKHSKHLAADSKYGSAKQRQREVTATISRSSNSKLQTFRGDEINSHPCWLERERRKYWNMKVEELQVSNETQTFNKMEFLGVLETAWALKEAELLQVRASQLEVLRERFKTVYPQGYDTLKKTSNDVLAPSANIHKNLEIISKTLFFIQKENSELSKAFTKTNRAAPEERLHQYLYELKRASHALFKALSVQERRMKNFENSCSYLSDDDEMIELNVKSSSLSVEEVLTVVTVVIVTDSE